MAELKAFPDDGKPSVIETDDGAFLVAADGTVLERLSEPVECHVCGDIGPWVDEVSELCEMCFEDIFGEDVEFPE